ncbi:hypothetical protein Bhyg_16522, partial [Pseudolycoriella hygida]
LKQLSSDEANAILLSTHLIQESNDYAEGIEPPINVSARDVMISHLYIYVHNIVIKCFLFLGLNSFVDYLRFDGIFFMYWLNKIRTEDHQKSTSEVDFIKYFLRQKP